MIESGALIFESGSFKWLNPELHYLNPDPLIRNAALLITEKYKKSFIQGKVSRDRKRYFGWHTYLYKLAASSCADNGRKSRSQDYHGHKDAQHQRHLAGAAGNRSAHVGQHVPDLTILHHKKTVVQFLFLHFDACILFFWSQLTYLRWNIQTKRHCLTTTTYFMYLWPTYYTF